MKKKIVVKSIMLIVLGLIVISVGMFNAVFHISLISAMIYGEKYGIASHKNKSMPVLSTTFEEFKDFFSPNSGRTELQKNAMFDQHFKGQRIKWTGTVYQVDRKLFGSKVYVGVKHTDRLYGYDVKLNMRYKNPDQKNAVADLNIGDKITYHGRLNYYGNILPTIVNDGIILGITYVK